MFEHGDWQHGGEHMLAKHRVSGDEANEALSDPDRLVIDPDYNSSSGRTVRIIGYSETLDDLLAVIVIEDDGLSSVSTGGGPTAGIAGTTGRGGKHEHQGPDRPRGGSRRDR